jgi:hypothetical protein
MTMNTEAPKVDFAFHKRNYLLLLGGILIVVIGYMLMSGGGSDDPGVFAGTYTLTDESFETLSEGEFVVSESVRSDLEPLRNKEFAGEKELEAEILSEIGDAAFADSYYQIRSATDIQAEIFSTRRISIAPVVVLFGYGFILYGIMSKGAGTKEPEVQQA